MSNTPSTFKEQWEAKKVLKHAKKKAKRQLLAQGFNKREANTKISEALTRIASSPARRASGRGR
jgi:hypothetical protein